MDKDIGRRLRDIRTRLGVSQRQLARVSSVANATISQIEAGKLNPTVSMLKKVLDGVPISMSEFFADDVDFAERIFFRAEELTEIADGGVSYRQVGAKLHNKSIQFLKECYQSGGFGAPPGGRGGFGGPTQAHFSPKLDYPPLMSRLKFPENFQKFLHPQRNPLIPEYLFLKHAAQFW